MPISEIPTDMLEIDLADHELDIQVCEIALATGQTKYGTGKSVAYRLETSRMIYSQIKAELERRLVYA